MLHNIVHEIVRNVARLNAIGGELVGYPHRSIPPDLREVALNAAGIDPTAIKIHMSVIWSDTRQVRRPFRSHAPLCRRIVGLAYSANLPIGPRLRGDPLDRLIQIASLAAVEKAILALRSP